MPEFLQKWFIFRLLGNFSNVLHVCFTGPMAWVYRCMEDGVDPRSILSQILSDEHEIPDVDDFTLWKLVVNLVSEPPPRNKLPDVNTLEDVIQLLQKCEKIIVLTGAGVGSCCHVNLKKKIN